MKKFEKFDIINVACILFVSITIILPLMNILALSFNDAMDSLKGGVYFWPREFTLANYQEALSEPGLANAFLVSVLKTVIGVVVHVAFTGIVAYAVSKNKTVGRSAFMKFGVATMYISAGMIPVYLLYSKLGLLDSFWVYIIPAMFSFYDMLLMMNFFKQIPVSLEESAVIDGANDFKIFYKIYLPLSLPILATIALFHGVWQWNDYITTQLYITNENLFTLQYYLYEMLNSAQALASSNVVAGTVVPSDTTTESLQLATMVITTIPILVAYPLLQKYFITGMTLGAVKE